jgi:hypothetical protein
MLMGFGYHIPDGINAKNIGPGKMITLFENGFKGRMGKILINLDKSQGAVFSGDLLFHEQVKTVVIQNRKGIGPVYVFRGDKLFKQFIVFAADKNGPLFPEEKLYDPSF